jgi:hypothetical protein
MHGIKDALLLKAPCARVRVQVVSTQALKDAMKELQCYHHEKAAAFQQRYLLHPDHPVLAPGVEKRDVDVRDWDARN